MKYVSIIFCRRGRRRHDQNRRIVRRGRLPYQTYPPTRNGGGGRRDCRNQRVHLSEIRNPTKTFRRSIP